MRGFPQELLIALAFGAIMLVQFLYRQLRRNSGRVQADRSTEAADKAPPLPLRNERAPFQASATTLAATPQTQASGPAARDAPSSGHTTRRFSRAGLMPDRRAVQDAIVIAAILKPCHARRTHDEG